VSQATRFSAATNGTDLAVDFQPHGLRFAGGSAPILTLTFQDADVGTSGLSINYVDDSGTVLEVLGGAVDGSAKTISAALQHFSRYCLGAD
jgi:hypothetical protein